MWSPFPYVETDPLIFEAWCDRRTFTAIAVKEIDIASSVTRHKPNLPTWRLQSTYLRSPQPRLPDKTLRSLMVRERVLLLLVPAERRRTCCALFSLNYTHLSEITS